MVGSGNIRMGVILEPEGLERFCGNGVGAIELETNDGITGIVVS